MSFLVIGLIFLLFSSVLCYSTCPAHFPCKCTVKVNYLEIECASNEFILDTLDNALGAFNKSDTIQLTLNGIDLGSLPSNFFDGLNVRALEIRKCNVISLSGGGKKPFIGLEDTLQELIIVSSLSKNTDLDFSHLTSLEEVYLSNNTINELENDRLPDSLKYLGLVDNGIQKLGDKAFENLYKLETIRLEGNHLGSISRSMLPNPAAVLRKLELRNNSITNFPDDLFTNMPKLRILVMKTEGIREIEKRIFTPIQNGIDLIDLRGNPLNCGSYIDWIVYWKSMMRGTCHSPLDKRYVTLEKIKKYPYPEIQLYKNWEYRSSASGDVQLVHIGD